jgi:uncharacterized SAM-binding protein YcdF (DUF218 family)
MKTARALGRLLRRLVRIILISLLVWALIACALAGAVHQYGLTDQRQPADVIIVLGSGLLRNNQPGPALVRRSEGAAALYREGVAGAIICTGGQTAGRTRSEADGCRQVLEAEGVPREVIILEERSRSTQENATYADEIMRANGWETAVIISDGYHLLRAQWIFAEAGVTVYTTPTASRPRLSGYAMALVREIAALHWQLLISAFDLPYTNFPL